MKKVSAMFIGWAFCLLAVSAHGADFVQTIDKAKDLYLTDHAQEAAIKAKEGVHQLWKEIPFNVRHVRLVDNLTDYHNKPNNIYSLGEKIYITSQVFGHNIRKTGGGYQINVAVDFLVKTTDGKVLGGVNDIMKYNRITPIPVTDFYLNLTYSISGARPGTYVVQTTVRDLNSQKSTRFDTTVVFK